ncbi:prolactin-releasing peptide receptor-like [Diadema setosum]|uniref:prolactin-releasing peptide receptor-like n=1 Tax=Diadema setosum TaxID=31175 RepID=UPI003B3A1AA5
MVYDNHTLLVAVGSLAVGLGVPGNLLIAVVFGRRKEKNATDVAIITLAVVDLFSCLSLAMKAVMYPLHGPADWTCIAKSMVVQTNLYSALFITLSLAMYRYVAVLHPFSRMIVARRAWLISAACVLLATLVQIPLIFTATSKKRGDAYACDTYGYDPKARQFYVIFPALIFLLSLFAIMNLYARVYHAIREQQKLREQMITGNANVSTIDPASQCSGTDTYKSPVTRPKDISIALNTHGYLVSSDDTNISRSGGCKENTPKTNHGLVELVGPNAVVSTTRIPPSSACDNKLVGVLATKSVAKQRRHADHKTTQMLMFITIIFFICWLPSVALRMIPPEPKQLFAKRVPHALTAINVLVQLKHCNHFINVFVYLIVNRKFRQGCVEYLRCGQ